MLKVELMVVELGGYIVGMKLFSDIPYVKGQVDVIKKIQRNKRLSISASAKNIDDVYYRIGSYCFGLRSDDVGFNDRVAKIEEKMEC